MKINNILLATNYLEFLNQIDSLVWELLYSPNNGYTLLSSKQAVLEAQQVVEKYDYESLKIAKKTDFENAQSVIKEKRAELIAQIDKHYQKEALVWADNVYQDLIENCLLCVSINKNNKESVDKLYNRALCAISWIKEVKGLNEQEQNALVEKFNDEFYATLYSNDEDNLPNQSPKNSDETLFLEIRSLILDDEEAFLALDLNNIARDLNQADILFFTKIKNDFATYKKTSVKDEIMLINTAIKILNLQNNRDKYLFIKQIEDDFSLFLITNKKLNEEDKLTLVKRRMNLYTDRFNKDSQYYKDILTSSLSE